eukprot:scaffold4768_cov412-Prasinococcus_capsulatus_cf.AAC.8
MPIALDVATGVADQVELGQMRVVLSMQRSQPPTKTIATNRASEETRIGADSQSGVGHKASSVRTRSRLKTVLRVVTFVMLFTARYKILRLRQSCIGSQAHPSPSAFAGARNNESTPRDPHLIEKFNPLYLLLMKGNLFKGPNHALVMFRSLAQQLQSDAAHCLGMRVSPLASLPHYHCHLLRHCTCP